MNLALRLAAWLTEVAVKQQLSKAEVTLTPAVFTNQTFVSPYWPRGASYMMMNQQLLLN